MKLTQIAGLALALTTLLSAAPMSAYADRHDGRHRDGDRHENRVWHGDIRHFHSRDLPVWRGGHWYHGSHGGHLGWWWIVGSLWYFYPTPVYPYPDAYTPPVVVIQQGAPGQPPVPQYGSGTPPQVQYWYYCESAGEYYPYVPSCPEGWKTVPATPADAPPR